MEHRGVADHHVETAVRRDRLRDERPRPGHGRPTSQATNIASPPASRSRPAAALALLGLNVREHDLRSIGGEALRARQSNALRGAGDDDPTCSELSMVPFSPCLVRLIEVHMFGHQYEYFTDSPPAAANR